MNNVEKLLKFLNLETATMEEREKALAMLRELFSDIVSKEARGLVFVNKEDAATAREILAGLWKACGASVEGCVTALGEGSEGLCESLAKLAGQEPEVGQEAGTERIRRIVKELRQQAGWGGRHPLSGFAGGPTEAEAGPPDLQSAVTQKEINSALEGLLAGIADNQPIVKLSETVTVARAAGDLCFYIKVKAKKGPDGFIQYPLGTWTAETHSLQQAVVLAARALRL